MSTDIKLSHSNTPQYSSVEQWYKSATVTNRPRRILNEIKSGETLFPFSRQPLVIHPIIIDKGQSAIDYILIQTAYRYMYEIATLETETVNSAALKIATNKHKFSFSENQCQQAMSIIVDEAYHAYVALDFIQQVKQKTSIEPVFLPKDNAVQRVLNKQKNISPNEEYYNLLELVTVCLSEHVLTKDLVYIKKESNTCAFFNEIMQDHLVDEIRHANYFEQILKFVWNKIDKKTKETVAEYLPILINDYINIVPQKQYEEVLLRKIGLNKKEIEEIIYDTHIEKDKNSDLNVINFISVLKKTDILDHNYVNKMFSLNGFIV